MDDYRGKIILSEATVQKKLSELTLSEEHYRVLTESMKDVVWVLDPETFHFTYVSPSVEKLRGYTAEEIMAVSAIEALTEEGAQHVMAITKEKLEEFLSGTMPPGTFFVSEVEQPCKDGSTVWTEAITSYHVNSRTGRVEIRGVTRDISQRREAQEALKKALLEKEIMFRELQHRVKNSLHLILSLITIEQGRATDPLSMSLLKDLAGRVNSLTRLYAILYQSGGINEVFLDEYLDQVTLSLMHTYASGKSLMEVERRIERIPVDMNTAAPLGIILNELLTNAFKYAFPAGKEGTVLVELRTQGREIELSVSDNGVGTPPGFDTAKSPGFGMLLIRMLVRQLSGSLNHQRNEWTKFQVRVPMAPDHGEPAEL